MMMMITIITITTTTNIHTIYEQVVTCMFSPNSYLFHHLFWKYNFLFTPTLSGTQPGHRSRSGCIPWHLLHSQLSTHFKRLLPHLLRRPADTTQTLICNCGLIVILPLPLNPFCSTTAVPLLLFT